MTVFNCDFDAELWWCGRVCGPVVGGVGGRFSGGGGGLVNRAAARFFPCCLNAPVACVACLIVAQCFDVFCFAFLFPGTFGGTPGGGGGGAAFGFFSRFFALFVFLAAVGVDGDGGIGGWLSSGGGGGGTNEPTFALFVFFELSATGLSFKPINA